MTGRETSTRDTCGSFEIKEDNRQMTVKNFHIPALKRNVSASVHRAKPGEPLFCTACEERHQLDSSAPVCIFLTDQNFPPSLPVSDGKCACILRIEDALLSELLDLLCEYFGKGKNCALAANSVIALGSVSHLALRGISNYVEELTRAVSTVRAMAGKEIYVCHYTYIPLGGIVGSNLVRELVDLDAWLDTDRNVNLTLPETPKAFWDAVKQQKKPADDATNGSRIYFLPESMQNARKIRISSGAMTSALPQKIAPFSEAEESGVIKALLSEIDANFGIKCGEPILSRSCATDRTDDGGTAKFAVFGGSHASRTAKKLTELGASTENCARGGWILARILPPKWLTKSGTWI